MRSRFTHKTNAQHFTNYPKLDTDPDHYRDYTEGTMIHLASGSTVALKNTHLEDIADDVINGKDAYLSVDDGYSNKMIAKKYIEEVESYRFYKKSHNWR